MLTKETRINNFHAEYLDVVQHWSPTSAKYAGGDALVTFLFEGWELRSEVKVEDRYFAGMRSISVYHMELERDGETIKMPVLRNPYVNRIVRMGDFTLVEIPVS